MKDLVVNQSSKNILRMIHKMAGRNGSYAIEEKLRDMEDELYYEILQRGTYTACILTIDDKIVGLGMTKRERGDKYSARVAVDVANHKAIKDWLYGIAPEWTHIEE